MSSLVNKLLQNSKWACKVRPPSSYCTRKGSHIWISCPYQGPLSSHQRTNFCTHCTHHWMLTWQIESFQTRLEGEFSIYMSSQDTLGEKSLFRLSPIRHPSVVPFFIGWNAKKGTHSFPQGLEISRGKKEAKKSSKYPPLTTTKPHTQLSWAELRLRV